MKYNLINASEYFGKDSLIELADNVYNYQYNTLKYWSSNYNDIEDDISLRRNGICAYTLRNTSYCMYKFNRLPYNEEKNPINYVINYTFDNLSKFEKYYRPKYMKRYVWEK